MGFLQLDADQQTLRAYLAAQPVSRLLGNCVRNAAATSALVAAASNSSGVGATVDGETGAIDRAGFGTGNKRDQGSEVVGLALALDSRARALRLGLLAISRVHVGVGGAGMDDIDRDAAAAALAAWGPLTAPTPTAH